MTRNGRLIVRVSGYGLVVLGLLMVLVPSSMCGSIAFNDCASNTPFDETGFDFFGHGLQTFLLFAFVVAGGVAVVLSHLLPERR
ncbi:hypothetical protein [Cellulosimicrobium sp. SL-1]|uniref:hypothetical protein n=1 Tax=Cellulosimicrobium sp. SL-1 TaxID=2699423 RepID=UPI0013D38989|nr:hypothetical protein [Cellulosimicrobium sp. SL-1]